MDKCIIRYTNQYSKLKLFIYLNIIPFSFLLKKQWIKEQEILIFQFPDVKKEINHNKLEQYLLKKGIKKIYLELGEKNKFKNLSFIYGENLFFYLFLNIIHKVIKKEKLNSKNSILCFLTDNPRSVKEYILKCIKEYNSFKIITSSPLLFYPLQKELKEKYGIFIRIYNNDSFYKKQNHIYINLERKQMADTNAFSHKICIDIFNIYKKVYKSAELFYKHPLDKIIKKHKLEKNIPFTAFIIQNQEKYKNFDIKVTNIKKL